MEKEHVPAAGEQTPAPRDDVRVTTNRCPFCHEDVAVAGDTWVACRSCQARHHQACWTESGACGSCGHERYLSEAQDTPAAAVVARPTDLGRAGLAVGAAAAGIAALGALLSYQSQAPVVDIPFGPRFETGEPGLNALGMLVVALLTVPMALTGAGLSVGGIVRTPQGLGRKALGFNLLVLVAIVGLAIGSW